MAGSCVGRELIYTTVCAWLNIGCPQSANEHLQRSDLGCCSGRNWSKLMDIWKASNETKTTSNWAFALFMETAAAPRKQPQPTELSHASVGVCEGVGCIRHQSPTPRNNARGVFVYSKLAVSSTKSRKIGETGILRVAAVVPRLQHQWTMRISQHVCWVPRRYFKLFSCRTRKPSYRNASIPCR